MCIDAPAFTPGQLAKCARRVYPRWVASGRMTQAEADRETAMIDVIAETPGGEERPRLL